MLVGLSVLSREYSRVLVLAVDAPTLLAGDLAPLMTSGPPGAAFEGFPLPMIIDPRSTPPDAQVDWPLRRLVEQAGLAMLALPAPATDRIRGANTAEERLRVLRMAGLA
jgi:molybdopterin-guanine dinucleotide biosynthesis protein A